MSYAHDEQIGKLIIKLSSLNTVKHISAARKTKIIKSYKTLNDFNKFVESFNAGKPISGRAIEICLNEYIELRKYIPNKTTLKTVMTNYRNKISKKFGSDSPINEISVCVFRLMSEETFNMKAAYTDSVNEIMTDRESIQDIDGLVNMYLKCLHSGSYIDKIVGLCGVTGRRLSEIGSTATFTKVDGETVNFIGQLKGRHLEKDNYNIPVLVDPDLIIATLVQLRAVQPDLIDNPDLCKKRTSSKVNIKCKKLLATYLKNPSSKDLRKAYCAIIYSMYHANRKTSELVVFSRLCGHGERDTVTARTYMKYIVDDNSYNS